MQNESRFKQFDLLRGTAVVFMISTHVASILFTGKSVILDQIMSWGITASFTVFLFSSAIVYGYKASQDKIDQFKSLKRSAKYLFWYYLLAVFVAAIGFDRLLNIDQLLDILTFRYLPPYTEFIVAFILYGVAIFALGNKGIKAFGKWWLAIPIIVITFIVSGYLYQVDFGNETANAIKSLFVGHADTHSFGALSYLPIFGAGLFIGQFVTSKHYKRALFSMIVLTVVAFVSEVLFTGYEMLRWPPNIQFLAVGLAYSLVFLAVTLRDYKDNFVTSYLTYVGRFAFEFFIYHVVILFLLNTFPDLRFENALWYLPAFIGTMFVTQVATALTVSGKPLLYKSAPPQYNVLVYIIFVLVVLVFAFGAGMTFQQANNFKDRQKIYEEFLSQIQLPNECIPLPLDLLGKSTTDKKWYLIGEEFTTAEQTASLKSNLDMDIYEIVYDERPIKYKYELVGKQITGDAVIDELNGKVLAKIDVSEMTPGEYSVVISADNGCSTVYSSPRKITVSYPVYVAWTIDWEGYFINQAYIDQLFVTADTYKIPMTHFFNSRYFSNPEMGEGTRVKYTDMIKTRVKDNGDYVGLHIHSFEDLMLAAGVPVENIVKEPNWGGAHNPGYDVPLALYSYEDTVKVLNWSKQQFVNRGLGNPIMFRAGGWQANSTTLKALEDTGFLVDSSGRTAVNFGPNKLGVPWNLSATTQPYRPNLYNQNSAVSPTMKLWEFPNNGGDSWAFSGQQMITRFDQNYDGEFATKRTTINFLTHPEGYKVDKPKLELLFDHIGENLYENDEGPVKYLNMMDVYNIYTK